MSITKHTPTEETSARRLSDVRAVERTDERILFAPEIVNFGGGERVFLSLLQYLHQQGLPHRLAGYFLRLDLMPYADWPLPTEQIQPSRNFLKAWSLKTYLRSARAGGARKPLLNGLQSALHTGAVSATGYSLFILDTPSLLTPRPKPRHRAGVILESLRSKMTDRLIRRGMLRAQVVVTNTKYLAAEIKELYGIDAAVSYLGIRESALPTTYRAYAPGKTLRFLSVCRLENNKRVDWILESLASLEKSPLPLHQRADWQLDIVGEGTQAQRLTELAQQLDLSERVVFHGHVTDQTLEQIYAGADLFLMPAVQGYGLPALEALTQKIPVVMHQQSGVSEILGGTPWVEIIAGSRETLTEGMQAMISRILAGDLQDQPLPRFPTEGEWAQDVCRLCGWI